MWYGQIQGNLGIAKSNEEIETARPAQQSGMFLFAFLEHPGKSQSQPEIAMLGFPPKKCIYFYLFSYVLYRDSSQPEGRNHGYFWLELGFQVVFVPEKSSYCWTSLVQSWGFHATIINHYQPLYTTIIYNHYIDIYIYSCIPPWIVLQPQFRSLGASKDLGCASYARAGNPESSETLQGTVRSGFRPLKSVGESLWISYEKPTNSESKNKRAIVFGSNHRIGILYQSITHSINQSMTQSINQSINILHDYIAGW